MESFKATLGNLAYQVQLAALNMEKKTELAALFHSSLIKGFKFLRPIHKPEKKKKNH